jgi:hypothetical protein
LYDYNPSTYKYSIATLSGSTYVNRDNGYWEYSPTGSTIVESRLSNIYLEPKYFFSTKEDAETLTPNSTSFHYAEVQDTRLPLSIENLYYNGCRITSDSLTTDSPDTPDGGPVVEITEVDSNILVFSGRPGEGLDTDPGVNGGSTRIMPIDNLVSVRKDRETKAKPQPSRVVEAQTLRPLPFIVRNTKEKVSLKENVLLGVLRNILRNNRG